MNVSFNKYLNKLERVCDELQSAKPATEKQKEIAQTVKETLDDLEHSIHKSRGSERARAMRLLKEVDSFAIQSENPAVRQIHNRVNELQEVIQNRTKERTIPLEPAKITLLIGDDHNGALSLQVVTNLKAQVPFIVPRSVFGCTTIEDASTQTFYRNALRQEFDPAKWDIYQQNDANYGDQFLVVTPKNITPEQLDLNQNHEQCNFVKISFEDAVNGPRQPYNYNAVFSLFRSDPSHSKLFLIQGHGSVGGNFSLNDQDYHKLLTMLSNQKSVGATLLTCYGGGQSTLQSLRYAPNVPEPDQNVSQDPLRRLNFPVIVRSIDDSSSFSGHKAEQGLMEYFGELEALVKERGTETIEKYRGAVKASEKGQQKNLSNLNQVYFPTHPDSPAGFRALDEMTGSYSLTYTRMRQHQLKEQITAQKGAQRENVAGQIELTNKPLVMLYPPVIDVPIVAKGSPPLLLSTLPGKALHSLSSLEVECESIDEFIEMQKNFSEEHKSSVKKAFLINKLVIRNPENPNKISTYENVVLSTRSGGKFDVFYTEVKGGSKVYKSVPSGGRSEDVSEVRYGLELSHILRTTLPASAATRAATGGQQDTGQLLKAIPFTSYSGAYLDASEAEKKELSQPEAAVKNARKMNANERGLFAHYLLICSEKSGNYKVDAAIALLKEGLIDGNTRGFNGADLIEIALKSKKNRQFIVELLKHQGDTCNSNQLHKLLVSALWDGDTELVSLILENSKIDFTKPLITGSPFLTSASEEHVNLLLAKGVDINQVYHYGTYPELTALSFICTTSAEDYESWEPRLEFLMQHGADPNLGNPTPIELAIKSQNYPLVDLLIRRGADPFKAIEEGKLVFSKLIETTPRSTLITFLRHEGIANKLKQSPQNIKKLMSAAIERGDAEIIREILKFDPTLFKYDPRGENPNFDLLVQLDQKGLLNKFMNEAVQPFEPLRKTRVEDAFNDSIRQSYLQVGENRVPLEKIEVVFPSIMKPSTYFSTSYWTSFIPNSAAKNQWINDQNATTAIKSLIINTKEELEKYAKELNVMKQVFAIKAEYDNLNKLPADQREMGRTLLEPRLNALIDNLERIIEEFRPIAKNIDTLHTQIQNTPLADPNLTSLVKSKEDYYNELKMAAQLSRTIDRP